jgi:hypothetical protein
VVSTFTNPLYPDPSTEPIVCQHIVIPSPESCALRFV